MMMVFSSAEEEGLGNVTDSYNRPSVRPFACPKGGYVYFRACPPVSGSEAGGSTIINVWRIHVYNDGEGGGGDDDGPAFHS